MLQVLALVAGIAIIIVGAELLVDGSIEVARSLAVSEAIIGLTVIAIGTSAPELVTTLVSTVRGDRDIAMSGTYSGCSWASRHQSRCGQRTALSLTSMVELRDVRLTLLG
jgi:Ca2+/H+ antiporter